MTATPFNNSFFAQPSAKWAVAGQVSGLAIGDEADWPRFDNFTSGRGSGDFAWLLNGAFHVQEGTSHDSNTASSDDLFLGMVESSMEGDGWNLGTSTQVAITDAPTWALVEALSMTTASCSWEAPGSPSTSRCTHDST